MEKMQLQANTALRSYALALLFFAAAFALRLLIDYVVPDRLPFITFFPAVLAAAYYSGLGPSILLLLFSAITGTIWGDPRARARSASTLRASCHSSLWPG